MKCFDNIEIKTGMTAEQVDILVGIFSKLTDNGWVAPVWLQFLVDKKWQLS